MVDDKRTLDPFVSSAVSSMAGGGGVKRMQAELQELVAGSNPWPNDRVGGSGSERPAGVSPGSGSCGRWTIRIVG
ncbi:hypothetical protein Y590_12547 [Methylobacterium sp. AMS5]|nr:hypothetical protein Y590_12547 [Methylobacterium sp. AMS5]